MRAWRTCVPAGGERSAPATVTDLLAHSSGLPAHRPYYETCSDRARVRAGHLPRTARLCARHAPPSTATSASSSSASSWRTSAARRSTSSSARRLVSVGAAADRLASASAGAWRAARLRPRPTRDDAASWTTAMRKHSAAWRVTPALFGTAGGVGVIARAVLARTGPPRDRGARNLTTMRIASASLLAGAAAACAGVGHHAAHLVVRHAHVRAGLRPHRIHRHVAVDRSAGWSLRGAVDEPRLPGAWIRRRHHRRSGGHFTTQSWTSFLA